MSTRYSLLSATLLVGICSKSIADDLPKLVMPSEATWVMKYDSSLDGEVKPKAGGEVRWRISVRNDKIAGSLAELKDDDIKNHRLGGEFVSGTPSIICIRQDGPNGLTCFYSGKLTPKGIFGTWFDNRGGSGDFVMALEKK
jgi:hypothetical protein